MKKKRKITAIPLSRLAPNFITIISLCLGISAVRYALDSKWVVAVTLILIAGFMDGLDGRLARLLNATSKFGAQLDSLADMVGFGVAPALVVYMWCLNEIPVKGVGWSIVLFYITCSALRLARFNSALDSPDEKNRLQKYFTGMPMPSAAGTLLIPVILSFDLMQDTYFSYMFVAPYMVLIGFLMVSRIPLFSFKDATVQSEYIPLLLLATAILIAAIILEPWAILPFIGIAYLATIPLSAYQYWKANKAIKIKI